MLINSLSHFITKLKIHLLYSLLKLYLSGNDAEYKFYRSKICSLTRISENKCLFEYFQANINNMKKTWIGIKNILNNETKKKKSVSALKDYTNNDKVSCDLTQIPDIFNEHFVTVGQKLANQLPSTLKCFTDFLGKY